MVDFNKVDLNDINNSELNTLSYIKNNKINSAESLNNNISSNNKINQSYIRSGYYDIKGNNARFTADFIINSGASDIVAKNVNLITESSDTLRVAVNKNLAKIDESDGGSIPEEKIEETIKEDSSSEFTTGDPTADAVLAVLGLKSIVNTGKQIIEIIGDTGSKTVNTMFDSNGNLNSKAVIDNLLSGATNIATTVGDALVRRVENTAAAINTMYGSALDTILGYISAGDDSGEIVKFVTNVINAVSASMTKYNNGVDETEFGTKMKESWDDFLNYFSSNGKVKILSSTPLDPQKGKGGSSYFGSLIMGTPFTFNNYADPTNRAFINSLVKDAQYVTFLPGFPKYNGLSYNHPEQAYNQNKTPTAMLDYITRNGLNSEFSNSDKRYYTFKSDYASYFAYLETMLNVIWLKLGLGTDEQNNFNIFSFFDIKSSDGISPSNSEKLISKYNSPIGFYGNFAGSVTESVNSQQTSFGSEVSQKAQENAAMYQKINYITGMGGGSDFQNVSRGIGVGINSMQSLIGTFKDNYGQTMSSLGNLFSGNKSGVIGVVTFMMKLASTIGAITMDTVNFTNTQDLGSIVQSFATGNGMMVTYPELWSMSSSSKGINFNFRFVSPYGDPLSIFKYVYVPFCSLLCLAMPRQAAENALVSPFLVRCNCPGVITSDLAMITDLTWVRGGGNSLWTKDNLPREIDVTLTVTDLYPYLAMTKHLSFLTANPSYTSFLDSLTGMLATTDDSKNNYLEKYFEELLHRVNDQRTTPNSLWNKYNSIRSKATAKIASEARASISASVNIYDTPWVSSSK